MSTPSPFSLPKTAIQEAEAAGAIAAKKMVVASAAAWCQPWRVQRSWRGHEGFKAWLATSLEVRNSGPHFGRLLISPLMNFATVEDISMWQFPISKRNNKINALKIMVALCIYNIYKSRAS